jgi:hypothetical protein
MKSLIVLLFILISGCSHTYDYQSIAEESAKVLAPEYAPFKSKSNLSWINELTSTVNCVVNNREFLNEVKSFNKYTHTTATPEQVYISLINLSNFNVSTYKARIGSRVIATTYKSDKATLYLNLRKNPRELKYMVNTVIHEGLHLAGYSHGDNSPAGKDNSVNYKVGSIAEKYADKCVNK